MTIEEKIQSAIIDLRNEGIEALEDIAADYGIKVDVLRARFEKAGDAPKPVDMQAKIDEAVKEACKRYGVPVEGSKVVLTKKGEKLTAVCRSGNHIVAVRHDIAQVWCYQFGCFTTGSFNFFREVAA